MNKLTADIKGIEKAFTAALGKLHEGNHKDALKGFEKLAENDELDSTIADRIAMYVRVCNNALADAAPKPENEEELLARAAYHINRHETAEALAVLDDADEKKLVAKDSVPYLRAQAAAINGDYDAVLENLKKAIKANPDNKILGSNNLIFVKAREENKKIAELLTREGDIDNE